MTYYLNLAYMNVNSISHKVPALLTLTKKGLIFWEKHFYSHKVLIFQIKWM